jgi:hypothetical protein
MENSPETKWKYHGVRVVHGNELDVNTAQTPGVNRAAAITHARAGAEKLWAGTVVIHPKAKTGAHHRPRRRGGAERIVLARSRFASAPASGQVLERMHRDSTESTIPVPMKTFSAPP